MAKRRTRTTGNWIVIRDHPLAPYYLGPVGSRWTDDIEQAWISPTRKIAETYRRSYGGKEVQNLDVAFPLYDA